jgi:GTP pyrophosphokinase
MVKALDNIPKDTEDNIQVAQWLASLKLKTPLSKNLKLACELGQSTEDHFNFFGQSCFLNAIRIAELVYQLDLNQETMAAAIIYTCMRYGDMTLDDLEETFGKNITKLVKGIEKMSALANIRQHNIQHQVDSLRRMLLAMVTDVRVVMIKLIERLCIMRSLKTADKKTQIEYATETMQIYAPLANRLGIHTLKWELEDIAFRHLESETYSNIAKQLQQRRSEREKNVELIIALINEALEKESIKAEIYGRAKHIYSIYRKMQRKNVNFEEIYDAHAVRILLDNLEDCYTALGLVHSLWQPIKEEFDDYINKPKPNGYQSIHTAVIGPHDKVFEIQIRTHQMHTDAEKGVAAHWLYKEGSKKPSGYEEKVEWLRQLLAWQKELTDEQAMPADLEKKILEDRVYVFTPQGRIVDLPDGSTPLDFAYSIHTDIGHRCRGAKIAGKIVPLTHTLSTGEKVEILTGNKNQPSRDWLVPKRGYLKTSRARAKVMHWFKQQSAERHINEGKQILEREMQRLKIESVSYEKMAQHFNFKQTDALFAALGNGDLKITTVLHYIENITQQKLVAEKEDKPKLSHAKTHSGSGNVSIYGVGNMLTQIAKCCKPVPGDPILGYITQGHGVSIHHCNCKNIANDSAAQVDRVIEVEWRTKAKDFYSADIQIKAYDRPGLVRDITNIIAIEKIHVTKLNVMVNKQEHYSTIELTIEVHNLNELGKILDKINQLPNVFSTQRV